jgi:hypothetical protein
MGVDPRPEKSGCQELRLVRTLAMISPVCFFSMLPQHKTQPEHGIEPAHHQTKEAFGHNDKKQCFHHSPKSPSR